MCNCRMLRLCGHGVGKSTWIWLVLYDAGGYTVTILIAMVPTTVVLPAVTMVVPVVATTGVVAMMGTTMVAMVVVIMAATTKAYALCAAAQFRSGYRSYCYCLVCSARQLSARLLCLCD